MGNTASNVSRYVVRKVRRFNIENRASKYVDKKVISAAPKPQSTITEVEKIREEFPNLMDEINKEDPNLKERLKTVYVSSASETFQEFDRREDLARPLPTERGTGGTPEQGYVTPVTATPGRLTLDEAIQLIIKHQSDKYENTVLKLSEEYNLKVKDTANLLDYCKAFRMLSEEERESIELFPSATPPPARSSNTPRLHVLGSMLTKKK